MSLSVSDGLEIYFRYSVEDQHGNTVYENFSGSSTKYIHGDGSTSPELEEFMAGLSVGENKKFDIKDEFNSDKMYTISVIIDDIKIPAPNNEICDENCDCHHV